MRFKVKEFNIYLDETILIVSFLCLFFSEVRNYFENYFICYLFIAFHEFSHMFVASIFGIKTTKLCIRISGLNINLDSYNRQELKWLGIYLAGPASNIVLALLFKNIPMVYTINLALAIINLIPIYPLDGYNIINVIISKKSLNNISVIFICLLFIYGYYNDYYSLIIIDIYLIFKNLFDNTKKDEKILLNIIRNMI